MDAAIIPHPQSGEVVDLATAQTEQIVAVTDALSEAQRTLKGFQALAATELTRRLDKAATWTQRFDVDGVTYEVKAASPEAGTESYDADALADALAVLIANETISEEAASKALKFTVTVTFECGSSAQAEALVQLAQSDPAATKIERSQKAVKSGINALLKIPGTSDLIEESKVVSEPKSAAERPAKVSVKA